MVYHVNRDFLENRADEARVGLELADQTFETIVRGHEIARTAPSRRRILRTGMPEVKHQTPALGADLAPLGPCVNGSRWGAIQLAFFCTIAGRGFGFSDNSDAVAFSGLLRPRKPCH